MKRMIAVVVMSVICSAAQAAIYEWVDGKGVIHFTDDRDKVPAAYRHKMKTLDSADTEKESKEVKPSAPEKPPAAVKAVPPQKVEIYGGHNEKWWRTTLVTARAKVVNAREQLAAKKASLVTLRHKRVVFQKPSDRVAYNALAEEISLDEEKIKGLEERLSQLEAEADQLGVPVEWRQ